MSSTWRWNPQAFIGSLYKTFSKIIFRSFWQMPNTSSQFPAARRTRRTVSGSRSFCNTDCCGAASYPHW